MITVNGNPMDAGCYVDGHWGQYGPDRVCELASDLLGSDHATSAAIYRAVERSETASVVLLFDAMDRLIAVADDAEQALNEATVGGFWTWDDGEFFLVSTDPTDYDDPAEFDYWMGGV